MKNFTNIHIAIPDRSPGLKYEVILEKAKQAGFKMITFNEKVYSLQELIEGTQSSIQVNPLFNLSDLEAEENTQKEKPQNVNFNKSFESLYNIAMNMADNCIGNKAMENSFEKLEEEYHELIKAFFNYNEELRRSGEDNRLETMKYIAERELKNEIGDVLFVLLHIGHKYGITAFELLHQASSKMLSRINNPNYQAKN